MQTVGQVLRAERERKTIDIKEVERSTSIRALYISAIENDDFSKIPGEVYVKGFIRNYANYLELNPEELLTLYRQSKDPIVEENQLPVLEEVVTPTETDTHKSKNSMGKSIVIGFIIFGAVGITWWMFSEQMYPRFTHESKPTPPVAVPAIPTPVVPSPVVPAAPAKLPGKPVILSAKFTDRCWIEVKVDGKDFYDGMPNVGEVVTWEANQSIDIKIGNAGVAELTFNNVPVGKLGEKGDVVERKFIAPTPMPVPTKP